jgi:hypothetical protein
LTVAAATLLIACGTMQSAPLRVADASVAVNPDDPCSLLSPDEVGDAAGLEVRGTSGANVCLDQGRRRDPGEGEASNDLGYGTLATLT